MHSRHFGVVSFVAVAVLALVLAGCGGGVARNGGPGTSGSGSSLSVLDKWQRFAEGNPTLRMTDEEITEAVQLVVGGVTHDLAYGWSSASFDGDPAWQLEVHAEPCEDDDCEISTGTAFAPVMEHNGIRIVEVKARSTQLDEEEGKTYLNDVLGYGGWLDHTIFLVRISRSCEVDAAGCSGTHPDYSFGSIDGIVHGRYSETTPTGVGSATWTGVMVGMESPEPGSDAALALLWNRPNVFLGDARITIDNLAAPDVDVSFTNIHNVTEGTRHRDMTWEGLSVEDGLFGDGSIDRDTGSEEYIAGMFTGPRHQEVGGDFRKDGIAGAFGAKRR